MTSISMVSKDESGAILNGAFDTIRAELKRLQDQVDAAMQARDAFIKSVSELFPAAALDHSGKKLKSKKPKGTGKGMSEENKQKARDRMKKYHENKKANAAPTVPPPTPPLHVSPVPPKPTARK